MLRPRVWPAFLFFCYAFFSTACSTMQEAKKEKDLKKKMETGKKSQGGRERRKSQECFAGVNMRRVVLNDAARRKQEEALRGSTSTTGRNYDVLCSAASPNCYFQYFFSSRCTARPLLVPPQSRYRTAAGKIRSIISLLEPDVSHGCSGLISRVRLEKSSRAFKNKNKHRDRTSQKRASHIPSLPVEPVENSTSTGLDRTQYRMDLVRGAALDTASCFCHD